MESPKVRFMLEGQNWVKAPLDAVQDVTDLRKAIGETMIAAFGIKQPYALLTLKAVKDYRDVV